MHTRLSPRVLRCCAAARLRVSCPVLYYTTASISHSRPLPARGHDGGRVPHAHRTALRGGLQFGSSILMLEGHAHGSHAADAVRVVTRAAMASRHCLTTCTNRANSRTCTSSFRSPDFSSMSNHRFTASTSVEVVVGHSTASLSISSRLSASGRDMDGPTRSVGGRWLDEQRAAARCAVRGARCSQWLVGAALPGACPLP